ncbi:MAG: 4-alpha-glucanotransferase, partial [Opitutales bacterium]
FLLDEAGEPSEVAGVPPDYFSETGQLWGNPLYDWEALAATGYDWWIRRLRRNFDLCDVVRLDHFRAFYDYWAVPAHAPDARAGTWRDGPREAIFAALKTALGEPQIIAEDLGEIGPEVYEFLHQLGLPGMAVLQFAFDGRDPHNAFLPHNLSPNSVVYPGTHDNDTTAGWYAQLPGEVQDQVRRYYRVSGEDISWDFVRSAFASVSRLCVVSAQDLLLLDARGRMNRPGVAEGNWSWRPTEGQMERLWEHAGYLRELTWLYGR